MAHKTTTCKRGHSWTPENCVVPIDGRRRCRICTNDRQTAKRRQRGATAYETHGLRTSPEYGVWCAMRERCYQPKTATFKYYGGRGISVCERWRRSFSAFIADMGRRPSPQHSIERRNNDGNYEPGNCYWATRKEQARNRRGRTPIRINGIARLLVEWSEVSGIPAATIQDRLSAGWPVKRAIFLPPDPKRIEAGRKAHRA